MIFKSTEWRCTFEMIYCQFTCYIYQIKNKKKTQVKFNCTILHNHQMTQQRLHAPFSPPSFFRSQSMIQSQGWTQKSVFDKHDQHHIHLKKYIYFTQSNILKICYMLSTKNQHPIVYGLYPEATNSWRQTSRHGPPSVVTEYLCADMSITRGDQKKLALKLLIEHMPAIKWFTFFPLFE